MTIAIRLAPGDDLAAFRSHVRRLLAAGIEPERVVWTDTDQDSLFSHAATTLGAAEKSVAVPRSFVKIAEAVACHRDPERWALLYDALWRIDHGERRLMEQVARPLVRRLELMAASVERDVHRMTAYVRFRPVEQDKTEHFIAWYDPDHYIVGLTSRFFIDRFASMRFSIMTPDITLHWDLTQALFGPGVSRGDACAEDAVEDCWKRYYAATFNPARSNPDLMKRHMPRRFWRDLPEAATIPALLDGATQRTERMISGETTKPDC